MKSKILSSVVLCGLSTAFIASIFSCSSIGLTKDKTPNNTSISQKTSTVSPTKTVVYAQNSPEPERNSLDIYLPSNVKPGVKSPIMIYVHGGGFRNGDKARVRSKPPYFNQKGFVFISTNYRLAASEKRENKYPVQHPAQVEDVAAAIAWVHAHANEFGGDPNEIFLMGHSAGAHLVALVSTDEKYLKAHNLNLKTIKGTVGLDTGMYDIVQTRENRADGSRIVETVFGQDPKVWKDASPISHVEAGKGIPPFLLTYTTNPKKDINENFVALLKDAGTSVVLIDSLAKSHEEVNAEIGAPNSQLTEEVSRFLDNILQNKTITSQTK